MSLRLPTQDRLLRVLSGVSYGMMSVLPELIGIAVAALAAFKLCAPIG
jgi:K(+)-stimulated pyrophosphate-energized sodium pump